MNTFDILRDEINNYRENIIKKHIYEINMKRIHFQYDKYKNDILPEDHLYMYKQVVEEIKSFRTTLDNHIKHLEEVEQNIAKQIYNYNI